MAFWETMALQCIQKNLCGTLVAMSKGQSKSNGVTKKANH